MGLMGKQRAQGEDHWWEWLWFFYPNGIKSFIAFGFFYFIGWHMYYQRSLLDNLSIKKKFFRLMICYSFTLPANYYLLRQLNSPYPEHNEMYK